MGLFDFKFPEVKIPDLDFLGWFKDNAPVPAPIGPDPEKSNLFNLPDLNGIYKALSDIVKLLSDIPNLLSVLNQVANLLTELSKAVIPFSCILPLATKIMESFGDLEKTDLAGVIKSPNLSKDTAREMSRLLSVPFVGDIARNEINLAWLERYMKSTGRGFMSSLDQLHYFANGGIGPSSIMSSAVSHVPDFFIDNDNSFSKARIKP